MPISSKYTAPMNTRISSRHTAWLEVRGRVSMLRWDYHGERRADRAVDRTLQRPEYGGVG